MHSVTETHEIRPPVDEQEATGDGLINVVEDRPAVRVPNRVDDEFCDRCDDKTAVFIEAGLSSEVDLPSGWLQDGERVRFFARFDADPDYDDGEKMKGWQITMLHHIDHIEKDIEDVARPGGAQAFATATLDQCGCEYDAIYTEQSPYFVEDRSVLRDVQVESISPIGDGDEPELLREPDEDGFMELKPTDPRPNFPDELNRWRKELLKANDAWDTRVETHTTITREMLDDIAEQRENIR
jgi:hypothetical protein